MRPVAASALACRFEDSTLEPPVSQRLRLTWVMTIGVPALGILLLIIGYYRDFFGEDAESIFPAITALTVAAGLLAMDGYRISIEQLCFH